MRDEWVSGNPKVEEAEPNPPADDRASRSRSPTPAAEMIPDDANVEAPGSAETVQAVGSRPVGATGAAAGVGSTAVGEARTEMR